MLKKIKSSEKSPEKDLMEINEMLQNDQKIKLANRSKLIGVLAFLGIPGMSVSGMVLDLPGSENHIRDLVTFSILISFTPLCIVSIIFSWLLFWAGNEETSTKTVLFPFVTVAFGIACIVYGFLSKFISPLFTS